MHVLRPLQKNVTVGLIHFRPDSFARHHHALQLSPVVINDL